MDHQDVPIQSDPATSSELPTLTAPPAFPSSSTEDEVRPYSQEHPRVLVSSLDLALDIRPLPSRQVSSSLSAKKKTSHGEKEGEKTL